MKALILNSGLGSRMGVITTEHPKCMTEISYKNTILSRQLRQLVSFGIEEVVMTTGYYDKVLVDYCDALHLPLKFTFVNNKLCIGVWVYFCALYLVPLIYISVLHQYHSLLKIVAL